MAFAFLFFDSVGGGEWLMLLAVVLIVIGPKNLPSAMRKLGQILSKLRRAADEFKRQIMTMDQEMEKVVADVKKEYINIGEEVDSAVTDETSPETASPDGDMGDGEDRAYDYYGDDGYDETGEMYSDTPPMMGEDRAEDAPSEMSAHAEAEAPSADQPAAAPEKRDNASVD